MKCSSYLLPLLSPLILLLFTGPLGSPCYAEPTAVLLESDQHYATRFKNVMVVAGEELATRVGKTVLKQGGNAVDAAVAVAFTLAVTLPRAGNIGGGGFALVRIADDKIYALDFRETAPLALSRDFYLKPSHSSTDGPTASGVPGTVAGLWQLHERFGHLPWKSLVEPAQKLASEGYPISFYEAEGIAERQEQFRRYPSTAKIFLPHGLPPIPHSQFIQSDLGHTLQRIAQSGAQDFYRGETAKRIAKASTKAGGVITMDDLASYRALWRDPLIGTFRGYKIASMPPPSSGGLHLLQMLAMVEDYPTLPFQALRAEDLHRLAEVMRLAYADRARYLGDPDFVDVPVGRLLNPSYLAERKKLIPQSRAGSSKKLAPELFSHPPDESPDTTHFNVVDAQGMAVSLTYTLNYSFGSGWIAEGTGILMNNEMDDFSVRPGEPNSFGLISSAANNVAARKRPVSSMTPTIVSKNGQLFCAVGAPGGSRIINGVFEYLLNLLGYGFNAQTSASLPRIHHQWYPDVLGYELGISKDTRDKLQDMGYPLQKVNAVAHVLSIVRLPDGQLEAGLDPRRPAYASGY